MKGSTMTEPSRATEPHTAGRLRKARAGRGWITKIACCGLAVLSLGLPSAWALINVRFTPADLIRGADRVCVVKLASVKDRAVAAEIVETIRGQAPADPKLTLNLDPDSQLSADNLGAALPMTALLVLAATEDPSATSDPVGALLVGNVWLSVFRKDGQLVLDEDKQGLSTIWAGSAMNLAAGARYVQADSNARFPVRSDLVWNKDQTLGKIAGPVHGCLVTEDGVIVLAEGGDVLFKADGQEKLATASKRGTFAVLAAGAKPELVSWTGKALVAGGKTLVADLPECLSLDALAIGRVVVGTAGGPLIVAADGKTTALPGVKDLGPGGLCVVADFDRDGRTDVLQLFAQGIVTYAGEGDGTFKPPVTAAVRLPENPTAAACGDYDTDGWLDIVVGGNGAMALLARDEKRQWQNQSSVTGELAYHGGANQPNIIGVAPADINADGRQGVVLLFADRKPLLFFNRGFGCFGWARELDPDGFVGEGAALAEAAEPKEPLNGWKALQAGQSAGAMLDLNGDNTPDLFGVSAGTQEAWVLYGANESGGQLRWLHVSAATPVTVTVRDRDRVVGMYVVRPGVPAAIARPQAGPVTLEWVDAAGKPASQKVVVVKPLTRATVP
jgi:hypothetical protein